MMDGGHGRGETVSQFNDAESDVGNYNETLGPGGRVALRVVLTRGT